MVIVAEGAIGALQEGGEEGGREGEEGLMRPARTKETTTKTPSTILPSLLLLRLTFVHMSFKK
jgi:hypothetical protein